MPRIFSQLLGRNSPPPAVLALLTFEIIVTGVLLVCGLPWQSLLASAGPVIALTLALLNPTVQELGRRQPKLSVSTTDGDYVFASMPRPWPIDAERVVKNEADEARQTAKRRHSVLGNFVGLSEPFAVRPSEDDHRQAQEKFEGEVDAFSGELSNWLVEYTDAARVNADTFEVGIGLSNAALGAHAEAVTVVLDLPETVTVVDGRPDQPLPPDRPTYQPPRPRPVAVWPGPPRVNAIRDWGAEIVKPAHFPWQDPTWAVSDDGRRLEASPGDIHPDRSMNIGEPLFFRAIGPGLHIIRWTAFTKSARKPAVGAITLEVPQDPQRPAFGRLHGITSYPDVPLVDENGEVVKSLRSNDPPARPESKGESDDVFGAIRDARAFWQWQALGLDPADDGPERVEVREAEPAAKSA